MNKLFIIDLKILFEDGERSRTFAILASLFVNFDTIRQFAQKYTTKLLQVMHLDTGKYYKPPENFDALIM